jgi:hypothetical protein
MKARLRFLPLLTEKVMTRRTRTSVRRKNEADFQRDDRGSGHAPQKAKKDLDAELDKSLQDSFPSSDPPSSSQPTNPEPAGDPRVKP